MHTAGLLLYLSTVTSATPLLRSEGVASLADGTAAYREVHWRRGAPEGAARWVQYLCPDGRPFARKELPGTAQPQARGYLLQDGRSGQAARVVVAGGQVSIDWKESAPDAERRAQVPLPADAVIDTGFDAAVRAHWPALLKGDEVRLPFLVPGRQRFYRSACAVPARSPGRAHPPSPSRCAWPPGMARSLQGCRWSTPMMTAACSSSAAPATFATPMARIPPSLSASPHPLRRSPSRVGSRPGQNRW